MRVFCDSCGSWRVQEGPGGSQRDLEGLGAYVRPQEGS